VAWRRWLAAALITASLAAVGVYVSAGRGTPPGRSFRVQGGETRPVLDPNQFGSRGAYLAYSAAQRYPQLLDKVYCYCYCDCPPIGHKSLLSCFAGTHGST
jgi:hypothetical protein